MRPRATRDQLRAKREQTREALLSAGRRLLDEAPVGRFAGHVRSADVTEAAKMSAGSLYYHWMSQDEYIVDLVEYVLDAISQDRATKAERHADDVFVAALKSGRGLGLAVRDAANQAFDELRTDPSVFLQMTLWAAHQQDEAIADKLKKMYQRVEDCWKEKIEAAVQGHGRSWRQPFTVEIFMTTVTALAEGLLLRATVDPDAVRMSERSADDAWSQFALATAAVYEGMTVRDHGGSPQDIRDLISQ